MAKTKNLHSYDVKVGRRTIHLTELGEGYPVILLHGGGPGASGMSNYSKNAEALAEHFRVLIPDMPGYGKSTKGIDRADPFGDLADGILGLMHELNIPRAHVVGNSLGGACALRMALEQSRKVSALVLMGPGGVGTTRGLPTKGLNKLLNYYGGDGPTTEKLSDFIRNYLVFDGSQVSDAVIQERFRSSIDPEVVAQPPLRRPNSLGGALRMDFTRDARLAECTTPTLVIWGADDKVNRPSGGPRLQRTMRNCDLYVMSNTGHWAQWERAEEFNELVTLYLKQRTPLNAEQRISA